MDDWWLNFKAMTKWARLVLDGEFEGRLTEVPVAMMVGGEGVDPIWPAAQR